MAAIRNAAVAEATAALRELILAGERYRQVASTYLGLDVGAAQAVSYLYSRGAMSQSELGALVGFNTSSITALVDRLERDDLARRQPHPADRRRTMVQLTKDGQAAVEALRPWFAAAFDHIDSSALAAVSEAMTTIATDLRAQTADLATRIRPNTGPPSA